MKLLAWQRALQADSKQPFSNAGKFLHQVFDKMASWAAKMLSALCLLGITLSYVSAAGFGPGSGLIPTGAAPAVAGSVHTPQKPAALMNCVDAALWLLSGSWIAHAAMTHAERLKQAGSCRQHQVV